MPVVHRIPDRNFYKYVTIGESHPESAHWHSLCRVDRDRRCGHGARRYPCVQGTRQFLETLLYSDADQFNNRAEDGFALRGKFIPSAPPAIPPTNGSSDTPSPTDESPRVSTSPQPVREWPAHPMTVPGAHPISTNCPPSGRIAE